MNTTNTTSIPQLTPHKHCEVIKAYADGYTIQLSTDVGVWEDIPVPNFDSKQGLYRVKPQPKPDVVMYGNIKETLYGVRAGLYSQSLCGNFNETKAHADNLRVVYSGETGVLLSVELIK